MSIVLLTDSVATIVYPGMAALSLFWVSVGLARWWKGRQFLDALLVLVAAASCATFALLALSTGLWSLIPFGELRLAIRLGWLSMLVLSSWYSTEFVRRQHEIYRRTPDEEG